MICGPPGVGKGTVLSRLAESSWSGLVRALSVTTRPPGLGEQDGVDYHFISEISFARLKEANALFGGTTPQFGFNYGVRLSDIELPRSRGESVIMESNLNGVRLAKAAFEGVVSIFLRPPSVSELSRRLVMRGRDDDVSLAMRIDEGRRMLSVVHDYSIDYFVLNSALEACISAINKIIVTEAAIMR